MCHFCHAGVCGRSRGEGKRVEGIRAEVEQNVAVPYSVNLFEMYEAIERTMPTLFSTRDLRVVVFLRC